MPRVTWVAEGGVKVTTCGVSAPANGAAIAGPGGVQITLGNVSDGHAVTPVGVQENVC